MWVKQQQTIPQITIFIGGLPFPGDLWHCFTHIIWLVSTPLKNISQWEG
jgi:hypothetical protein